MSKEITYNELHVELGKLGAKIDATKERIELVDSRVDRQHKEQIEINTETRKTLSELKESNDRRSGAERVALWFVGIGMTVFTGVATTLLGSWFKGNN